MAWIIESLNPFEPLTITKTKVASGTTIQDWVVAHYPLRREFPSPTICLHNGKPVLRKTWSTTTLQENDVVNFVAVQGWEYVVAVIVAVVLSVVISLLMPVPDVPNDGAKSDPVFSIKGQGNSIRLGEPIECNYGRNRIFPAYASRPYFEYADNDQFQHTLFCLGHGEYEIHNVQIGDSDISAFQEASYEFIEPGGTVTLFPTNVYTAPEAGGQSLYAPNQAEVTGGGWVGPFAANPIGTQSTKLQIDIVYPKGIYVLTLDGFVAPMSVTTEVQRRLIDDTGAPLGPWVFFEDGNQYNLVYAASTTPQRRTFSAVVPAGRYEVRVRRSSDFLDLARAGNDAVWEGLRGWINLEQVYGNVTLLAVKIRATNNLNDRTNTQINVVATRKLPTRESGGTWSDPIATRSIVWAFVDVFRSAYGGRVTDDVFFDWDALEELESLYAVRGDTFDWIFRDPITVWDAAKIIAMTGRAIPLLSGSLITMRRDGPLEVPVAVFNQENIVEGSFEWNVKLWDLDEKDCLRVEYTDASTGYKQETVMCILPGETSDHPEDLRLMGVQSRTQAYREGLYRLANLRYRRENVTFVTGLEGYIPVYGDLIGVSHDVPKWGQAGYVVNAQRGSGDQIFLWLSEPLNWDSDGEHNIVFRGSQGQQIGPFEVFQSSDPMQAVINTATEIDFLLDGTTEPMLFMFGILGRVNELMKVVAINPQGKESIQISAVNEAPIVHSFDELVPSALGAYPYAPVTPDLPEIANLYITSVDGALLVVQIAWTAAFGSLYYIVQTSEDGTNWADRATVTRTSVQLQVRLGELHVRVAAVNVGQGPWITDDIWVGPLNGLGQSVPWEFLEWAITWFDALNAAGYQVKVYDNSGGSPVLKRTVDLALADDRMFEYNYTLAVADSNVTRQMLVTVDVLFPEEGGTGTVPSGTPTELALENLVPAPPTGLAHAIDSVTSGEVNYELSWAVPAEDDLIRIKVWLSPTDGFDPAVTVAAYDFTAGGPGSGGIPTSVVLAVDLDSFAEHPQMYWRVGLFDVWGNEISTNISTQATIPAHP